MIDTDHYIRFERVDSVDFGQRGLEARLHGERLRIEVVRPDVVRIAMSRGGRFDETPTFAVCIDPFSCPGEAAFEGHPARSVSVPRLWSCRWGWTRSGSMFTAVTAHRWWRRLPTSGDNTGLTPP